MMHGYTLMVPMDQRMLKIQSRSIIKLHVRFISK